MLREMMTVFYEITRIVALQHAYLCDLFFEISECFKQ